MPQNWDRGVRLAAMGYRSCRFASPRWTMGNRRA